MSPLPIEPVLPAVKAALGDPGVAVLQAPPGAGKTTRVPLVLSDSGWLGRGTIVVIEPRRLAARMAARRMADMIGEPVGATVGYRVRLDSRVGPETRIELVTDGLFLRRLQDDPSLEGVGAVLFDEFHERRLDADLCLALCLEARAALRPDLRLLAMSATLDGGPIARLLGNAPVLTSEGRSFPVETRYLPPPPNRKIEELVAAAIRRALTEETGDILAFLPGGGEIRRVQALLDAADLDPGTTVVPLYGDLALDQQDRALRPALPGGRKIVLATAIAETSLTIEGIRVVIDGGLMRVPRFDPASGMARLATVRVSQASADQRRGRAGRLGPGICYRLWPESQQRALAPFTEPEILAADLAPLALELALWGITDPGQLAWLDPPPPPALAQARDLLEGLGAIDRRHQITEHGRRMAGLGVHPRLGHMMLKGRELGLGALACTVAALLGERDLIKTAPGRRDADLALRVEALRGEGLRDEGLRGGGDGERRAVTVDRGVRQQVVKTAGQWRRQLGVSGEVEDSARVGDLIALAYPDRIARWRGGQGGHYQLTNGRGAALDPAEPLAREEWLAVAELDGDRREARIFLAARFDRARLETLFEDQITTSTVVAWDDREQAVLARRRRLLGELAIEDTALAEPAPDAVAAAMLKGIRHHGLALLPWTPALQSWRHRVDFLRRVEGAAAGWPDLTDQALLDSLDLWLAPFLNGASRAAHLKRIDLAAALSTLLPWPLPGRLDALAPTHLTVPSGSRLAIDYDSGDVPVLAVKLQEMFGASETPTLAEGRVSVLLHLLSPARRPVQITRDLAGFWTNSYPDVCRDLRGRYPKHPWPDDPLAAAPTRHAKPRGG